MTTATYYVRQETAGQVIDRFLDRQVAAITAVKTITPGTVALKLEVNLGSHSAAVLHEIIKDLGAFPHRGERWPGDMGACI